MIPEAEDLLYILCLQRARLQQTCCFAALLRSDGERARATHRHRAATRVPQDDAQHAARWVLHSRLSCILPVPGLFSKIFMSPSCSHLLNLLLHFTCRFFPFLHFVIVHHSTFCHHHFLNLRKNIMKKSFNFILSFPFRSIFYTKYKVIVNALSLFIRASFKGHFSPLIDRP